MFLLFFLAFLFVILAGLRVLGVGEKPPVVTSEMLRDVRQGERKELLELRHQLTLERMRTQHEQQMETLRVKQNQKGIPYTIGKSSGVAYPGDPMYEALQKAGGSNEL